MTLRKLTIDNSVKHIPSVNSSLPQQLENKTKQKSFTKNNIKFPKKRTAERFRIRE